MKDPIRGEDKAKAIFRMIKSYEEMVDEKKIDPKVVEEKDVTGFLGAVCLKDGRVWGTLVGYIPLEVQLWWKLLFSSYQLPKHYEDLVKDIEKALLEKLTQPKSDSSSTYIL